MKGRFNKYLNQLNEIKHRLHQEIYGDGSNLLYTHGPASSHRSTITSSASLSVISHPTTHPENNSLHFSPSDDPRLLSSSEGNSNDLHRNEADQSTMDYLYDPEIESTRF